MELDNVDKIVLEILKERNKGTQPSVIFEIMGKRPQAVSRSLKKLLQLDLVISNRGSDKRKIFYTAR